MTYEWPSQEQFKLRFKRNFVFSETDISDFDISVAVIQAKSAFKSTWDDQEQHSEAAMLLIAHFLETLFFSNGVAGSESSPRLNVTQRTVGSVSESLYLPVSIGNNPVMAQLSTSSYGQTYLTMLAPRRGGVLLFEGETTIG